MTINAIDGSTMVMGFNRMPQSLTDEQKQQVADILSQHDASSLTTEDAKSINDAFREAGIRPSKDLRTAIEDAGFDANTLRSLAPPPPPQGTPPQGPPPQGPPPGNGIDSSQSDMRLNTDALATLQSILDQYDLSNMTSDQENELANQLKQANLFSPGMLVNQLA